MTSFRSIFLLVLLTIAMLSAQQTRPERSNYEETSRYQDVMDFIDALKIDGGAMKLTWLGYSMQGKHLPMIVYGDVPDTKPETIRKSGKLVVYIQGNIHAGEVEGKEALLELLRELKQGQHSEWRRRLVLLIVPIFNADGNEMISLYNRPWQHGPVAGMGQRANAQNLDLNRDHMKLETPEVLSFVRMLNEFDPHITVDLHTTNGSFHGYHITYSYGLNPDLDPELDRYTRADFFPKVESKVTAQKFRVHRYGDYLEKTPAGVPGFYFWATEPRFNSNYVGFRNRLAILSEAFSYVTFQQRIAATKALVYGILDVANAQATTIKEVIAKADAAAKLLPKQDSLGVRSEVILSDSAAPILMAAVKEERNPYSGEIMYRMNEDSLRSIITNEFYGTRAAKKAKIPARYYIPDSLSEVIILLREHGIRLDTLRQPKSATVQRFLISENKQAEREFQKHKMRTVSGKFESASVTLPAGTVVAPMDQPLSRLLFFLLEPESEDGVVTWNVADKYLGNGTVYPIVKEIQ